MSQSLIRHQDAFQLTPAHKQRNAEINGGIKTAFEGQVTESAGVSKNALDFFMGEKLSCDAAQVTFPGNRYFLETDVGNYKIADLLDLDAVVLLHEKNSFRNTHISVDKYIISYFWILIKFMEIIYLKI